MSARLKRAAPLLRNSGIEVSESSEAQLLEEAKRIAVNHSEKPADDTLDAVLIAAARIEWQSLNARTDLF
jgi:hypothetical protein